MHDLLVSFIVFIVIYLFYVIFVINKKKKLEKMKNNVSVLYLVSKYNIDIKKINMKVFAHVIALSNSFIISITFFIISFVDNYYLKLLVCIAVIVPVLYIMYMIIGKMYQKKK